MSALGCLNGPFFVTGNRHFLTLAVVITLVYTWVSLFLPMRLHMFIDVDNVVERTDSNFLSFGLDTSFIYKSMQFMTASEWEELINIARLLSPSYLRFGGTAADRLVFAEDLIENQLVMRKKDWLQINNFVSSSNLKLLFDLNVLLRKGERWDGDNAKSLLEFSKLKNIRADFQLGNEPNSFFHVFNVTISPEQLGEDFSDLWQMLRSDDYWKSSLLVGPDVTRPKDFEQPSVEFLKHFINKSLNFLDAVTWHQYYLNGRIATKQDFLNPLILERFRSQAELVTHTVRQFSKQIPIWLTETGSAFGGGAPNLSDRFISTFLFLDKLGLSALLGIKLVVRQSLYGGNYALVDKTFLPNPDFWVALLYKHLVGNNVFNVSVPREDKLVRLYAHSAKDKVQCYSKPELKPHLVVFGMNIAENPVAVDILSTKTLHHCATYVFTSFKADLTAKAILLNGLLLYHNLNYFEVDQFLEHFVSTDEATIFPPYSLAFWVFSLQ